jgi:hypothetical protein
MFNYVTIKHKQMSFVSNGGKFKLYTVDRSKLIFPTPTQPRISFERAILKHEFYKIKFKFRGMWVVYSVDVDGCQSICRDPLGASYGHKMHFLSGKNTDGHGPTNP